VINERGERPLRVLHVAEFLQGGIATYLNETLPFQQRSLGRTSITLVAPRDHARFLAPDVECNLALYDRTGRNVGSFLRLLTTVRRQLAHEDPDIVHLHSTFAGIIVRILLLTRRRRPRVVYCAHGWGFLRSGHHLSNPAVTLVERALVTVTDAVVSISGHEHAAALEHRLPHSKCRVIRYGLNDLEPHGQPPPRHDGPLRLLFVGRHDRQKGLDVLLDAFTRLDPERFELSIAGASALDQGTTRVASASPHVSMLGWLAPDEVTAALRRHDVLVVPSRWEGFGFVALEAMRSAVAVVCSRRGSLPEVLGEADGGWIFDPPEPASLAATLTSLDRERTTAAGQRGRARYERFFRAERMNRETLALYDELTAAPPSSDHVLVADRASSPSELNAVS
jgi:glycosyltransferase involved in cell wall biosynthesis